MGLIFYLMNKKVHFSDVDKIHLEHYITKEVFHLRLSYPLLIFSAFQRLTMHGKQFDVILRKEKYSSWLLCIWYPNNHDYFLVYPSLTLYIHSTDWAISLVLSSLSQTSYLSWILFRVKWRFLCLLSKIGR